MSVIEEKLCEKIISEYFGEIVAEVANALLKKGSFTLKYIYSVCSKLSRDKINECLCVLIKHNLVTWDETKLENTEYTLHNDRVLLLLRYPKYINLIHEQFGDGNAEAVIDLLIKEGQATASQIIIDCSLKYLSTIAGTNLQSDINNIHILFRNSLDKLVINNYVERCSNPQTHNQSVPIMTSNQEDLFRFDTNSLDLKQIQEEIHDRIQDSEQNFIIQATKTVRCHPDKDIYWRLSPTQFHLELRDKEIKKAIANREGPLAAKCISSVLDVVYRKNDPWVAVSNSITASEVRDQQRDFPLTEQYLSVIADCGAKLLRKVGDAGGGEYIVDIASFIRTLTMSHIDGIVRERYGSNAARIFNLVRNHGKMLQNQITKLSLISGKEASPLVHKLLKDNFFRMYEVRKGVTPTPASKNFYLIFVETTAVVRMCLSLTYQAIYNLMKQRDVHINSNRRLLEKKSRTESILSNLKQSGGSKDQIQDLEESFTPAQIEQVTKIIEIEDILLDSITSLDETVFLLKMFLHYEI